MSSRHPEVALLFPPLVGTSFGRYYPSLAVLAGSLQAQGVEVLQRDLNEAFAEWLVEPGHLDAAAQGHLPGGLYAHEEWPLRVAARMLYEERDGLFDREGRHRFDASQGGLAVLLTWLASAYQTDVPLAEAVGPWQLSPVGQALTAFYTTQAVGEGLPRSVHTVGISVPMGPQLAPALLLARMVKAARPGVAVILGGSAVSLLSRSDLDRILQEVNEVDALVRFDGEGPLSELVAQRQGRRWDAWTVPGVSTLRRGRPVHQPAAPGPALDALPRSLYDPEIMGALARKEVAITQARGCYWGRCAYCDYVELYKGSAPYRYRTAERFADELAHQREAVGAEALSVITEAIPPGFARRLSQVLIERGLQTPWHSFAMVDRHFDPELLSLMAESGCERLVIGVETMTDRVLELVEKHARREDNLRFIREVHDAGIEATVNLIPDLPSTTADEAMAALGDFRSVADCISAVSVFPFEPTRSSRIGREPQRYGLMAGPGGEAPGGQAEFAANHLDVRDPAMSDTEREGVLRAYLDFAGGLRAWRSLSVAEDLAAEPVEDGVSLRIADQHLVAFEEDGVPQLWHLVSQERLRVADGWDALLAHLRSVQPFTREQVLGLFSSKEQGEDVFSRLVGFGLLAWAEAPG